MGILNPSRPDEPDLAGPSFAQTWLSRQKIPGCFLGATVNGENGEWDD